MQRLSEEEALSLTSKESESDRQKHFVSREREQKSKRLTLSSGKKGFYDCFNIVTQKNVNCGARHKNSVRGSKLTLRMWKARKRHS